MEDAGGPALSGASSFRFDAPFVERARRHLGAFRRRSTNGGGLHAAAVAIVLTPDGEGRACFLLTRRAATLRAHARQWALPGGRVDRGETVVGAALRELREELSLAVAEDHVLGILDDYPTRSGFLITPVVVWADAEAAPSPNPAEVAAVYHVPLDDLEGPDIPRLVNIPESDRPVIQLPILGTLVHAPTAAVLFQLREVVVHGRATRVDHFEQPVWAWR